MAEPAPILAMRGVGKRFPGVVALDGVDFRLFPGEVHALMGENGAGKSTLIKVLTGVYEIDDGTIELSGVPVAFSGPQQAQSAGVSTVYQEINLCPNLSVAENIYIGREPRRLGMISFRAMRNKAAELLGSLGIDIDPGSVLAGHSIAVQQMVAIARAVDISAKILILDEPTSSLDTGEVEQLFRVVRGLRDQGLAIVFVTHFLDQVYEIADRITVLRNGQLVGEYRTAELPQRDLVEKMIGKELQVLERLVLPDRSSETLLDADQVGRTGAIAPFSLTIHAGEVVGLAGLLGSGRSELARLFFGADKMDSGELRVDGSPVTLRGPRSAMEHDIAYLSENRRAEGLIEELSVRENVILALQAARGWSRPLSRAKQDELVMRYIEALSIRPADPNMPVRNLSGGNQQKVLLARWLITEPRLLILDEPTRGIDVGAKADIQRLVVKLAGDGLAVLFISAELEEVLRLSHKIAVLRDRVVVAQMENTPDVDANTVMNVIASGAAG